jgi:hypothetical protein
MSIDDFNHIIDFWINELAHYSFNELCTKPSPGQWSMGQMYLHLVNDTNYFLEQMKICVATNDSMDEEASANARKMFLNNNFPDEIIEGAASNSLIPQPGNKEELERGLIYLKHEINEVRKMISKTLFKGKTKHPGLNYFNAKEWLLFAEMHLRHHLKQKKRIDDFLKNNNP